MCVAMDTVKNKNILIPWVIRDQFYRENYVIFYCFENQVKISLEQALKLSPREYYNRVIALAPNIISVHNFIKNDLGKCLEICQILLQSSSVMGVINSSKIS